MGEACVKNGPGENECDDRGKRSRGKPARRVHESEMKRDTVARILIRARNRTRARAE